MGTERILALDMSTKTGWSVLLSHDDGNFELLEHGKVDAIHQPDEVYPRSMVNWAYLCYAPIIELVDEYTPDVIVIEETASGSKSIESQKILEYLHFLVAKMVTDSNIPVIYLLTEQWRRIVGCVMSLEEKKHNKKVKLSKLKPENKTASGASIAYDENGKRIGKLTRKHINVRRANEVFGKYLKEPLRKKDEDIADSLLLGYAHHVRRTRKKEVI